MSRTYRNPRIRVEHNEISYLNSRLWSPHRNYEYVYVPKSKEEYETEYKEALKKHEAEQKRIKLFALEWNEEVEVHPYLWYKDGDDYFRVCRYTGLRRRNVFLPPYKSNVEIRPLTKEQIEERREKDRMKDVQYYRRTSRDGFLAKGRRAGGFKTKAKRTVRRANKAYCNKVLRDEDWEDISYPNEHIGDTFVWDFW